MNDAGTDVERGPLRQKKHLRPIIFSHDMLCSPIDYVGLISDIVARGYIVLAPYHQDGSCSYTVDAENEPVEFNLRIDQLENRGEIAKRGIKRAAELLTLRKELVAAQYACKRKDLQHLLKMVDFEHLAIIGHGLGGHTAFLTAQKLTRASVKACITLDPFWFPFYGIQQKDLFITDVSM